MPALISSFLVCLLTDPHPPTAILIHSYLHNLYPTPPLTEKPRSFLPSCALSSLTVYHLTLYAPCLFLFHFFFFFMAVICSSFTSLSDLLSVQMCSGFKFVLCPPLLSFALLSPCLSPSLSSSLFLLPFPVSSPSLSLSLTKSKEKYEVLSLD